MRNINNPATYWSIPPDGKAWVHYNGFNTWEVTLDFGDKVDTRTIPLIYIRNEARMVGVKLGRHIDPEDSIIHRLAVRCALVENEMDNMPITTAVKKRARR